MKAVDIEEKSLQSVLSLAQQELELETANEKKVGIEKTKNNGKSPSTYKHKSNSGNSNENFQVLICFMGETCIFHQPYH